MKKTFVSIMAALLSMTAAAQSTYDLNKPFGFCTVSSRTDASSTYNVTGGGVWTYPIPDGFTGKVATLKSNGLDMKGDIQNAIKNNDVVILDGSQGEFIVSQPAGVTNSNRTIIGINNACIRTQWYLTEQIQTALDAAEVLSKSTSSSSKASRKLPNGQYIETEEREFYTRKTIIEQTGDNNENYRRSGIFEVRSQNIIIRNLKLVGPGSADVGGVDLISFIGAKNCWVDHCSFQDGQDGNFDITNSADFNTVSWCTFSYTSRSYDHMNTNLIGSSDNEATGYLNTTFAFNWWGTGCKQRMPMARVGKIHLMNNYYTCSGSSNCINPRKNSEFLIEGNYIDNAVSNFYSQTDAKAVTWANSNYTAGKDKPADVGSQAVTVPYDYTVASYSDVPTTAINYAGPKLPYGDNPEPTVNSFITWAFNTGEAEQAATLSGEATSGIASATVTIGSELTYGTGADPTKNKTLTAGGYKETLIWQKEINTSAADGNAITFSIKPKNGYTLKATSVSFTATRNGTDKGKIDAKWIDGNGTTLLCQGATPKRNSTPSGKPDESPYYTTYTQGLDGNATSGEAKLVINLYDLAFLDSNKNNVLTPKSYGFCNITIEGVMSNASGISVPVVMSVPMDNTYYNLKGQRVANPTKGLYIINGKKVVIK